MRKKAQVLVIGLWILAILALLALGIGYRVSLALKVSRYHRDRLAAKYLAFAGVRKAIAEIRRDDTVIDTLEDGWAINEDAFKNITLAAHPRISADIGYLDDEGEPKFGLRDEEAKINLNTAAEPVLTALFKRCGEADPARLARAALVWRGDRADDENIYADGGGPKAGPLTNIQEFCLFKEVSDDEYKKIRDYATVYGEGKINLNTVSQNVLDIFLEGVSAGSADGQGVPLVLTEGLAAKIIQERRKKGYFLSPEDFLNRPVWSAPELDFLGNHALAGTQLHSDNFLIEVTANAGRIKAVAGAVYDRRENKIVYWHER